MRSFALLSLVLVTSCASVEPKPFRGPNGNAAYWMECSGMGRTLDACYKKADELCQRRWVFVDMVTEIVAVPVHRGFIPTPFHSIAALAFESQREAASLGKLRAASAAVSFPAVEGLQIAEVPNVRASPCTDGSFRTRGADRASPLPPPRWVSRGPNH